MPFFESDDATLYYAIDGSGHPIILLHCLPLDHRIWWNQVFALSTTFKTFALDIRGLGLSEGGRGNISIQRLSHDLYNLMENEGIDKAVIVGLSMGGTVAQQFLLDHPERVKALVLSGTMHSAKPERLQLTFLNHIAGYGSENPIEYFQNHLRNLLSKEYLIKNESRFFVDDYVSRVGKMNFHNVVLLSKALQEFHIPNDELESIKTPTLIIEGEKDTAFKSTLEIADLIPGAVFHQIDGASHLANVEKPIEFNAKLTDFLKKLEFS